MRIREGNKDQDILNAAIKTFASEGYYNAKISKIAETAGVATGSVYLYYQNKEYILKKIFDNLWEKIYNEVNAIVLNYDLSPIQKLDNMIDIMFENFSANPDLALVFVNEQNFLVRKNRNEFTPYYEKFLDIGESIIIEGIEKNYFNKDLHLIIFRNFILGGVRHLLHQWAQFPDKFDLNEVRKNVKFIVKEGILIK